MKNIKKEKYSAKVVSIFGVLLVTFLLIQNSVGFSKPFPLIGLPILLAMSGMASFVVFRTIKGLYVMILYFIGAGMFLAFIYSSYLIGWVLAVIFVVMGVEMDKGLISKYVLKPKLRR